MELISPPGPEEKRCPECGETKSREAFVKNRSSKDGLGAYCRPCHNLITKRGKERLYGGERSFLLKLRYGIDEQTVRQKIEEQNGLCAICRKRPAKHIDHCHKSGKIREICCFYCNRGLGKFKEDISRMRRAIEYLSLHTP
jgi:hypothetical protein